MIHLPFIIKMYSALFLPMELVASHRYVPLSVLFKKVIVNSLPFTTILSGSGSSPPSFVHNTGSGLQQSTIKGKFRESLGYDYRVLTVEVLQLFPGPFKYIFFP